MLDKNLNPSKNIVSIGRLTKQKNFMFLCRAFKEIIEENDQIKLLIAGNGEEEIKLKEFIRNNNWCHPTKAKKFSRFFYHQNFNFLN